MTDNKAPKDMPETIWIRPYKLVVHEQEVPNSIAYTRTDISAAKIAELEKERDLYAEIAGSRSCMPRVVEVFGPISLVSSKVYQDGQAALKENIALRAQLEAADGMAKVIDKIQDSTLLDDLFYGEKTFGHILREALAAWDKCK